MKASSVFFNNHTAKFNFERVNNDDTEFIRKDLVDDMLSIAEDHAYFAGSTNEREKMIKKALEWINYNNNNGGCQFDSWEENCKDYMKGE